MNSNPPVKLSDAEIAALTVLLEALQPYAARPEAREFVEPIVTCLLTGYTAGDYGASWSITRIRAQTRHGNTPPRLCRAWSYAEEVIFAFHKDERLYTERFLMSVKDLQQYGPD